MLQLDEATHTYTLAGQVLPSVTELVGPLNDYGGIPASIMEAAAHRGRMVHLATELYDQGDLDEASLDPALQPYLNAYKKFRADTGFVPTLIEAQLHHPVHKYAGTIDRGGELWGKNIILDLKATASIMPAVKPQTAAYLELANAAAGTPFYTERRCLQLKRDGTYRLSDPYTDRADWSVFLSLLNIHNWRQRNGAKHEHRTCHTRPE